MPPTIMYSNAVILKNTEIVSNVGNLQQGFGFSNKLSVYASLGENLRSEL